MGFYGLTVMPTEFQKIKDNHLARFRDVFVLIDDLNRNKGNQITSYGKSAGNTQCT